MVACKTIGDYKRNQEKIRKFCLEEAKAIEKAKPSNQRNSPRKTHPDKQVQQIPQQCQPKQHPKTETKWTKDKLVKLATHNQSRQQSKSKTQQRPQSPMLKKKFKSSTPKHSFNYKAQQAALMESANTSSFVKASSSKTAQPPSEVSNRSFLIFNFNNEADQSNIQTHYIESDNPDTPPHVIHTSDNPVDFMRTSPNSPPIYPMDTTTPDGENIQAEPPLISIIPAPSYEPTPHGETDIYGTNRDEFTKSTSKLDKMVNKIRKIRPRKENTPRLPQPHKYTNLKSWNNHRSKQRPQKSSILIPLTPPKRYQETPRTRDCLPNRRSTIAPTVRQSTKHRRPPQNVTPFQT